jgi:hypothetical protein
MGGKGGDECLTNVLLTENADQHLDGALSL